MSSVAVTAEELLDEIRQDAWRLRYVWGTARHLFASDKTNVAVMNAVAGEFFGMTQRLLFTDIVLRVSRLTDPARNRQQENVTLARLVDATGWEKSDPARWTKFTDKLKTVTQACGGCRNQRHKVIAHKDLNSWRQPTSLTAPTIRMIESAMHAIEGFVSEIAGDLTGSRVGFDLPDEARAAKRLLKSLTNRASQKSEATSTILYSSGERDAVFQCGYCGEANGMRFYPDGEPPPARLARRHFDTCHGVIGCEEIGVDVVEQDGREPARRITIDLKIPMSGTR